MSENCGAMGGEAGEVYVATQKLEKKAETASNLFAVGDPHFSMAKYARCGMPQ